LTSLVKFPVPVIVDRDHQVSAKSMQFVEKDIDSPKMDIHIFNYFALSPRVTSEGPNDVTQET
jgi:hypothetical protein